MGTGHIHAIIGMYKLYINACDEFVGISIKIKQNVQSGQAVYGRYRQITICESLNDS